MFNVAIYERRSQLKYCFLMESFLIDNVLLFESSSTSEHEVRYMASLIEDLVPKEVRSSESSFFEWMQNGLPLTHWLIQDSSHISFILLTKFNPECRQEDYFEELLRKHLFPGKEPAISLSHRARFHLRGLAQPQFFLMKATVVMDRKRSFEHLEEHFSFFSKQLSTASLSAEAFNVTLAVLLQTNQRTFFQSFDQKIFQIQKNLDLLIERFPTLLAEDLLKEWGCFLGFSSSLFWEGRSDRHLSRLIVSQFFVRKKLKRLFLANSDKREFLFRFLPTHIHSFFGKKPVVGVLIASILLDKHEYFDEEHVLHILRKWIPGICLVQGSRYLYQNHQEEQIRCLYLELDKEDGAAFSLEEKRVLRKVLSQELKNRVQKLMPTLFTVRNEEQVMKNIILLSQQIDSSDTLPQMMLSFEKQTASALMFTVILVYAAKGQEWESLLTLTSEIKVTIERKETVGYLGDGFPKEALVFHLHMPKNELLRGDFSLNAHLARHKAYAALSALLGELRDYNGGLILKQEDLFLQFEEQFPHCATEKPELLEDFFYSISPIEKQATLSIEILKKLFSLSMESYKEDLNRKDAYGFHMEEEKDRLYVFIQAENSSLKEEMQELLKQISRSVQDITSTLFPLADGLGIGLLLESDDPKIRRFFLKALREMLVQWQQKQNDFQILRLNFANHPVSLDPRQGGDTESIAILGLLFEGLMSLDSDGKPEGAVAESVAISPKGTRYTFHLRNCFWSNGMPIQAYDFEYTWKKILSPNFKTPFVHHFYPIVNAWAAKEGLVPVDDVGVRALDEKTLQVDLGHRLPYFLELVTLPVFSPVSAQIDIMHPQWMNAQGNSFVCNGAFLLKKNRSDEGYLLEKNPLYRDASSVQFHQIVFSRANSQIALQMFYNDELDWLGRPFCPWSATFETPRAKKHTITCVRNYAFWCALNVQRFPFSNLKLRQSLSLALDRQKIIELFTDSSPAFSPIPMPHTKLPYGIAEAQEEYAQKLFKDALQELNLNPDSFPVLNLICLEGEKREKTALALQMQWKKTLGIDIHFQVYKWETLFHKLTTGDYEMGIMGWFSPVNDPLYTLSTFKSAYDPLNFSKWENEEYQERVEAATDETDSEVQEAYLTQAEALLIKEVPVIPLLYESDRAIKNEKLCFSMKGTSVDFKTSTFKQT